MNDRIDHARIRQVIVDAIGPWSCIHEAREKGVHLIAARDMAIEMALPLGPRIAQQFFNSMPQNTRVEIHDLEQAGRQGVLEGIDRYKPHRLYQTKDDLKAGRPGRPIQVNTYLFMWIRKRVHEETAKTHWRISKPPRAEMLRYMKGEMNDEECHRYANLVLNGDVDVEMRDTAEWVPSSDDYFSTKHRAEMA